MSENTVAVAGGVGKTLAGAPEAVTKVVPDEVVEDEVVEAVDVEVVEDVVEEGAVVDGVGVEVVEGEVVEAVGVEDEVGSLGLVELEPDAAAVVVPGLLCEAALAF